MADMVWESEPIPSLKSESEGNFSSQIGDQISQHLFRNVF